MPRRVLFAIVLCALACNGESPTAPPPNPVQPPTPAVLLGRTVAPDGTPVPDVTLTLVSTISESRIIGTTTSGPDGRFEFAGVTPGSYPLRLRVPGGTDVNGGYVRLLPGLNTHEVLVSTCKIPYGTVRDAVTGRPLEGAKVTIFWRETTTDANGRYSMDFGCDYVQGGTILFTAEHPGYLRSEAWNRASGLCSCAYDFLLTPR